jgi:PhzF family phenazine biosynthesis protein
MGRSAGWDNIVPELDYIVVDAFTERPFCGNPAAVVFGADGHPDGRLQDIAREFNLTATTFVLPSSTPDASIRFRWFTPCKEAQMCGHATVAGVFALLERGQFSAMLKDPNITLGIDTAGGILSVQVERLRTSGQPLLIWLDLPRPQLTTRSVNVGRLCDMMGMDIASIEPTLPIMETQDEDLIVFVKNHIALFDARPRFTEVGAWCARHRLRGICLATVDTLSPSMDVQSRFFAPASGVNEESATGSVHGPLAAYLMAQELVEHNGHTAAITCVQAEAGGRAGLIRALVTQTEGLGFAVKIAGQCRTTMRGRLEF